MTLGDVRGSISPGSSWRVHAYLGLDNQTGKDRYLTRTVQDTGVDPVADIHDQARSSGAGRRR